MIDTVWAEPKYLHLSVPNINPPKIIEFVEWDLEREHGDLGLKSSPPLSALGISLQESDSATTAKNMAFKIAREAHDNITMAKLGLDAINI
jgi:hypothetical protein